MRFEEMISGWKLVELYLIDLNFNFFRHNYEYENSLCQIYLRKK